MPRLDRETGGSFILKPNPAVLSRTAAMMGKIPMKGKDVTLDRFMKATSFTLQLPSTRFFSRELIEKTCVCASA